MHQALNNLLQHRALSHKEYLTPAQVREFLAAHGLEMKPFNVLILPGGDTCNVIGVLVHTRNFEWIPLRRFGKYWVFLHPKEPRPTQIRPRDMQDYMSELHRLGELYSVSGGNIQKSTADVIIGADDFIWPEDDEDEFANYEEIRMEMEEDDGTSSEELREIYGHGHFEEENENWRLALMESEKSTEAKYGRDLAAAIEASLRDASDTPQAEAAPTQPAKVETDANSVADADTSNEKTPAEAWESYRELVGKFAKQATRSKELAVPQIPGYESEPEGALKTAVKITLRLTEVEAFQRKAARRMRRKRRRSRAETESTTVPLSAVKSPMKKPVAGIELRESEVELSSVSPEPSSSPRPGANSKITTKESDVERQCGEATDNPPRTGLPLAATVTTSVEGT